MISRKSLAVISASSLFLVVSLTGCETYYAVPAQTTPLPQTQLKDSTIPDTVITERVRAALADSLIVPTRDMRIVTIDHVVCLYGVVGSYVQADEAARIAKTVEGVRKVELYLTIVPTE
jgi:osmotically-inducible protein OsmY